jgi:hypothetical protein
MLMGVKEAAMHEDPALRNLPPRAEALAARHEVEDMPLGGIKGFVVFLAVMLLATFIVVWLVIRILLSQSYAEDAIAIPFAQENHVMPDPQLEPSRNHNTLDWQDLQSLRDEEKRKLTEFAWIGPDKHAARIPIETAMQMLIAQGLPTRQGAPTSEPAALPIDGGAGGLMVAPANPLTLPPGNQAPGNPMPGYQPEGDH